MVETLRSGPVLIIDDEAAILEVLSLSLQIRGIEVFTAKNGKEALEVLHRMPRPALILLDLMMPVMNGWDFLQALDANPEFAGVPVALVTAFPEEVKLDRAVEIFSKPIDLRQLYALIERCQKERVRP